MRRIAAWLVVTQPFKIPQSVLVVIHTPALDVLLINRADAANFWQSVTGAKDREDEPLRAHGPARGCRGNRHRLRQGSELTDWSTGSCATSTTSTRAGSTAMRRA